MDPTNLARNITYEIDSLLEILLQRGASDLHLKGHSPPGFRVDGRLMVAREFPPLPPQEVLSLAKKLMPPDKVEAFDQGHDVDFSFESSGVSRYRVSVFRQRGNAGLTLRRIPLEIPDIERLGLPEAAKKLALLPRGLVLVTGPTGSGKSTTLAAMIDYLNRSVCAHIVTLEDPIEFVHRDQNCFITQREIGSDSKSYHDALDRVLRQDPDVIMIGELRDSDALTMALTAAETGHLVFATLHTTGATQTVDRVIDAYPPEAQSQIRVQLGMTLQGVLSQTLVRKIGGGRTAAFEIMVATEATRSCIREGKSHQLANLIQTGGHLGMQTLNSALADLVRHGLVSEEEGRSKAAQPEDFDHALRSGGVPLRAAPRAASPLRRTEPTPDSPHPSLPREVAPALSTNKVASDILEKLRRS